MDVNRKELSAIKEVLKESPRGMTVTEISRSVKMNRHSVAKYLEVLVVAGHVDMKTFGPSKVYYLSQRVPVSAMLSLSSDLIVILDRDLRVRNVNDKFLEYVGLKREDILNKNIENFAFARLTKPPLLSGIMDAMGGKELTVDTYYDIGDREYYLVVKFIPTIFEDGEKGLTIIASDYTEHKHIEKMVSDSERKFRNMLEQSTDGIIMIDERGAVTEYNKSLESLTGYGKDAVIGKRLWEIPHFLSEYKRIIKGSPLKLIDHMRKFLKTGKLSSMDPLNIFNITRPDGMVRTIQANIFPIKTDKGYMICVILRDITDIKNAEMAIKESEEKFRNLAETTTSGILIIQDDHIVYANHGIETITGYRAEELFKVNMGFFVHPDHKEMVEKSKQDMKKFPGSPKKSWEIKIITNNGETRWISITLGTMILNGRPAILKTFVDITERKEAEEALLMERARLERRVKERTIELERVNEELNIEVDQRRHSEEAARQSEEKYKNLVESINDVVWEKDGQGRFTYMGPKIRDMMGYMPEEFIGNTILDYMHPADADAIREGFWQIFREPMTYSLREMRVLHKDGHEVFVEANGTPMYDEQGNFQGYRGVTRDVTARKHAEEALHKIEDKYRALVENINDIAWEMDRDGRFIYVSPKARDIMGYDPGHYLGKAVTEFMPPEDVPTFNERFRSIFNNPRPFGLQQARMYHKDGSILDVEANGIPFFDGKGEFCGYRGVTRDVTKRKRMEEMLELMKYSIDHSEDAAFWVNPDAGFYYVNDAASRMLGYSREELLSMNVKDIDINFTQEGWRDLREMLKEQKYHKMESIYRTKEGGAFLAEITENYLEFNGKEYDFAFVRPISPPRHGIARPPAIEVQKNKD
jgi:PAS domain S-box-containing protein